MKFFLREQRKVPEHIEELILRGNGYSDQCFFSKQYYVLVLPDFTCPPRHGQTILQITRRQKKMTINPRGLIYTVAYGTRKYERDNYLRDCELIDAFRVTLIILA